MKLLRLIVLGTAEYLLLFLLSSAWIVVLRPIEQPLLFWIAGR